MDEEDEIIENAAVPLELKKLRACLRCALIKSVTQFYEEGCENCPFLRMDNNQARVIESTTAFFEGMIALVNPEGSWVARWQRISSNVPGLYAIEVLGELTDELKDICRDQGVSYRQEMQNSK